MGPHDECCDDSRDGSKQYPKSVASREIPEQLRRRMSWDDNAHSSDPAG